MDAMLLWYLLAAVLIVVGLAGTILPALPGVPVVFAGMWLAAWVGDYQWIGTGTLIVLGVLAGIAVLADLLAGILGARRIAATGAALWGAAIGTVVGLFFGLVGLLFGPFLGAIIGEASAGRTIRRSTVYDARRIYCSAVDPLTGLARNLSSPAGYQADYTSGAADTRFSFISNSSCAAASASHRAR